MGIIAETFQAITKLNLLRPPLAMSGGFVGMAQASGTASPTASLGMMTASGWVFAVIDRIASSIAATRWRLYQVMGTGDLEEITRHPMLDLWNKVNPFMTREEFLEVLIQHFELAGEMWMVLMRNKQGMPIEMWPVRPDRMTPVPGGDFDPWGYDRDNGQGLAGRVIKHLRTTGSVDKIA